MKLLLITLLLLGGCASQPKMDHESYYQGYEQALKGFSEELLYTCKKPNGGIVEFVSEDGEYAYFLCKALPVTI